MKCQKCDKPATFHITELTDGNPQELHLCEEHARQYLSQSSASQLESGNVAAVLAQQMAQHMAVGQTAEELARLDRQVCPVCGISFYDFRSQGRLGCPHDYRCFEQQLNALILNIHGETEHIGKVPKSGAQASKQRTQLIQLRREMKEAITEENYERAGQLRDTIQRIEQGDDPSKTPD
ncbi:MAG: UvrB/UvrC motif-containing protein [Pirellulales bacterium]|nr:UvrB/UvrC motif-containing protein [Pirellulales bacterium]